MDGRKALDVVRIRANRAVEMARQSRPGLRRELLTMDYVLPLKRRRGTGPLSLKTHSPEASGTLYFGRDSFAVDRVAYFGIFLEGWYRADFRGATVIDIGAHKGYFGAFALHEGAAEVRSYEPEKTNFAALSRAAGSFDKRWIVNNEAVSKEPGEVMLHVNVESAGHSIVQQQSAEDKRPTLRSEAVPVVAMRDVLADVGEAGPLIVKIDAEGAECDIVLGTPVDRWAHVDHVFLEIHDFAPCSSADIIAHLEQAGLRVVLHEVDAQAEAELVALKR
jgi:FkbM family methyltransferase